VAAGGDGVVKNPEFARMSAIIDLFHNSRSRFLTSFGMTILLEGKERGRENGKAVFSPPLHKNKQILSFRTK